MANGQSRRNGPAGGSGPKPRRTPFQALIYWTAVLSVWGLIFLVAFFAMFATDLPDTSKIFEVKRQPSISYLDRSGALIAVRGSQYAPPVDLDKLPDYVPKAFIAIEDRWFYWHVGFNPWGIIRSQAYNLTHRGGPLRGGSTISQQTAKNVFLWPDRSYVRKGLEAYFTVLIEAIWGKRRIMEVYLNSVEWGPGVYGAEAAARKNFGVSADKLTSAQAARLAAILPSPLKWRAARPGPYVRRRSGRIDRAADTVRNQGLAHCVLNAGQSRQASPKGR